jgi:hypothetical protein
MIADGLQGYCWRHTYDFTEVSAILAFCFSCIGFLVTFLNTCRRTLLRRRRNPEYVPLVRLLR